MIAAARLLAAAAEDVSETQLIIAAIIGIAHDRRCSSSASSCTRSWR